MLITKIISIGNSAGLILSKEALASQKLSAGDTVFVTEGPNGLTLSPYDPAIAEQIKLGEQFMQDYRDTFKALAK